MARKARVPATREQLLALLMRDDITALELERCKVAATLLLTDELAACRAALREAGTFAGRALEVVLKQHLTLERIAATALDNPGDGK